MRTCVTYTRIPVDEAEENELFNCQKEIKRLINCLHHSIVLAVQHYGLPKPYDINATLVEPQLLKGKEPAAIHKAEAEKRDSTKEYGEQGGPDNKGRPALIACLLSQKGKTVHEHACAEVVHLTHRVGYGCLWLRMRSVLDVPPGVDVFSSTQEVRHTDQHLCWRVDGNGEDLWDTNGVPLHTDALDFHGAVCLHLSLPSGSYFLERGPAFQRILDQRVHLGLSCFRILWHERGRDRDRESFW